MIGSALLAREDPTPDRSCYQRSMTSGIMASDLNIAGSTRNLRALLATRQSLGVSESDFCTADNLEKALSTLSEEFESFGLISVTTSNNKLESVESMKLAFIKLINASWSLVHKHRALVKTHDQLDDVRHKIANDNSNLINHVKRLKDDLEKKQQSLCEAREKERRLKVQCESLSRDLKREKDETVKLRKQSQSKDSQHAHELRRIQQSGHRLREQLQKSIGTHVSKDKVLQNVQADHEKQLSMYRQTIRRLEGNNELMLREINDLREALTLHSAGIDLQVEASGIWHDVET